MCYHDEVRGGGAQGTRQQPARHAPMAVHVTCARPYVTLLQPGMVPRQTTTCGNEQCITLYKEQEKECEYVAQNFTTLQT